MKIQYCSDLHLEFRENNEFLRSHPLPPEGNILLLAGDIAPFRGLHQHDDFFDYISEHFDVSYWVPGNHEYYRSDIAEKSGVMNEKIRSNVLLVNNTSVVHDNVKIIFSTLWSKISPGYQWQIERSLNDFHVIKSGGYRFSATRYNELHKESLDFIRQELSENREYATVVVTHHVPTFLHYPEKYKGDALNEAFAVELFDFIETNGPDYWIFGHHHCNIPGFVIGRTQLLTNQLGYVKYNEHREFDGGKRF